MISDGIHKTRVKLSQGALIQFKKQLLSMKNGNTILLIQFSIYLVDALDLNVRFQGMSLVLKHKIKQQTGQENNRFKFGLPEILFCAQSIAIQNQDHNSDKLQSQNILNLNEDQDVKTLLGNSLHEYQKVIQLSSENQSKKRHVDVKTFSAQNKLSTEQQKKLYEDVMTLKITHEVQAGFQSVSQSQIDNINYSSENSRNQNIKSLEDKTQSFYDNSLEKQLHGEIIQIIHDKSRQTSKQKQQTSQIDEEFLGLIQDNNSDVEDIQEDMVVDSVRQTTSQQNQGSDQMFGSLPQVQPLQQQNQQSTPPIGYGLNNTQNQNELREVRHHQQQKDGSLPSQDLLDIIGQRNSSLDQQSSSIQISGDSDFARPMPQTPSRRQVVNQLAQSVVNNSVVDEQVLVNLNQIQESNPLKSVQNQGDQNQQNQDEQYDDNQREDDDDNNDDVANDEEDDGELQEATQEQYENWLENLTEVEFNCYLRWFDVNIGQSNLESEEVSFFPPDHDFTIKDTLGNSIVDRIKETANRRMQNMSNQMNNSNIQEEQKEPHQYYDYDRSRPIQESSPTSNRQELNKKQNGSKKFKFPFAGILPPEILSNKWFEKHNLKKAGISQPFKHLHLKQYNSKGKLKEIPIRLKKNNIVGSASAFTDISKLQADASNSLEQHSVQPYAQHQRADNNYNKKRSRSSENTHGNRQSEQGSESIDNQQTNQRDIKRLKRNTDFQNNKSNNNSNKSKRTNGFM
eukprot:403352833